MPGRHARLSDFVVDALAACAGLVFAAALDWAIGRVATTAKGNLLSTKIPAGTSPARINLRNVTLC